MRRGNRKVLWPVDRELCVPLPFYLPEKWSVKEFAKVFMVVYFPNVCVLVDYRVDGRVLKLLYQSLLIQGMSYWVPLEPRGLDSEEEFLKMKIIVSDNCTLYRARNTFLKQYEAQWKMVSFVNLCYVDVDW